MFAGGFALVGKFDELKNAAIRFFTDCCKAIL